MQYKARVSALAVQHVQHSIETASMLDKQQLTCSIAQRARKQVAVAQSWAIQAQNTRTAKLGDDYLQFAHTAARKARSFAAQAYAVTQLGTEEELFAQATS